MQLRIIFSNPVTVTHLQYSKVCRHGHGQRTWPLLFDHNFGLNVVSNTSGHDLMDDLKKKHSADLLS